MIFITIYVYFKRIIKVTTNAGCAKYMPKMQQEIVQLSFSG
jgi:hypothetical protein